MDSKKFIRNIKQVVHDDVIKNLINDLENPSGRKPPKDLIALSKYISNLSETDRSILQKIISHATHNAIFGLLCVLDGVRVIENSAEKGALKLYWEKGDEKVLINNPKSEDLHDIYQSEVYSEIFRD
jgi:hypothetical protein